MQPTRRVADVSLSTTIALDTRAKALIGAGRDVINMAVGEPDFPAPRAAQRAAIERIESGDVRYTAAGGAPSVREAVARHLSETRGVPFRAAEVVVCHSAKHALANAVLGLVEPGDEVLLPLPAWVSYVEQLRFAGAVPVPVAPRPDQGPDLVALAAAVGPRTRGVLLNSPSNPSGYVWTGDETRALCDLAERHDLWMISDEIYRRLVYEGEPNLSPASVSPASRARTVVVDGASKAFAMTGYRIGFLAAPEPFASAVVRLQSQLTGAPNTVSQAAYEACLVAEPEEVPRMVAEFGARREVLLAGLERIGLATPTPRGAFYAFCDASPWLDARGVDGLCEDLLEEQLLAAVPGSAFGVDTHIRLSYAIAIERIEEAVRRMESFFAERPVRSA